MNGHRSNRLTQALKAHEAIRKRGSGLQETLERPSRKKVNATIAIIVIVGVAAVAVGIVFSFSQWSYEGSSATFRVTVKSFDLLTVYYEVFFDGSSVKSGSVEPLSSDSFDYTYRWPSSEPKTVVISVESSGGFSAYIVNDPRTVTVSDGGHYTVNLVV